MLRRRFLALAAGCGAAASSSVALAEPSPAMARATKAMFDAFPRSAGVSLGVLRHGRIETYSYGVVRRGQAARPTAETLYPIASITKTFTGVLLAQAELGGRLKLDDDIRLYLDGAYPNLAFEGHPIRVMDLVDHRSGLPFFLPDRPEFMPDFVSDTPWSARVNALEGVYGPTEFYADLHKVMLKAVPGETFSYSNTGASLAALILERVHGRPFEVILRNGILAPLGMTNTAIALSAAQKARVAPLYDGKDVVMPPAPTLLAGAGGITSNVNDLLKYAAWHLAEADPAVRLSHRPVLHADNYSVGLNWQIMTTGGERVIWQSGNLEGLHSYCILQPERDLALVALFNQADDKSNHAHEVMVNEIMKGLDPRAQPLP